MRDAGYISLEARKRAQVIWQPSQAHDEQTDFYILHTHRQMIDVLESMRLCLPPLCSGLCDLLQEKDIRHLYKMLSTLEDNKNLEKRRLLIRDFNVYLLQRYHNDMILDLYLTTFSYIEYPLLYHTDLFSSYHGTLKHDYEQLLAAYTDRNRRFVYDFYDHTICYTIQRIREHAAQIQLCGNHCIPEAAPFSGSQSILMITFTHLSSGILFAASPAKPMPISSCCRP